MKKTIMVIALVFVLMFVASAISFAQTDQKVTITATVDGLLVPETVTEGLITLTFDNQSEAPILPVPSRLLEDVTQEDFLAAMEESQDAALALMAMQGGTFIFPEEVVTVTYDFAPGQYLLVDFAQEMPVFEWFVVEASDTELVVEEPEHDVEVILMDFAFGMPVEIEAGEQVWHIENIGGQWHEMAIMQIEEGMTIEDVEAMFFAAPAEEEAESHDHSADAEAEEGSAEGEQMPAFLWIPMEAGEQAWVTVDLAPGTYVVGCMLPNLEEMGGDSAPHMHAELGMLQIITVK